MMRSGGAPAHYSDNWLLGFYFGEVVPRLDRKTVWPELRERADRLEGAVCSGCKRTETFTYQDSQFLHCAHKNSCGTKESVLERLAGCARPSGTKLLEAIQEAARLAGVLMPKRDITPEEREAAKAWGQRKDCLEAAAAWAQAELLADTPAAEEARAFLQKRGFSDEQVLDLEIGLFTSTAALREYLAKAKLNLAVAKDAALFRGNLEGYVVFPWRDEHGNLLTLYGRWPGAKLPLRTEHPGHWKEDAKPEIPKTYALPGDGTKADPLYFDRVKHARCREVVLVEGVIDAAIAQVQGDARVCAYVAGTLAGKQVEALTRYRPQAVIVCPDPDAGGDRGVLSSVARLNEAQLRVYVAPRLPEGKDPDEYILANGIDCWRALIDQAEPAAIYMTRRALTDMNPGMPAKRREDALRTVVGILADLGGEGANLDKNAVMKLATEKLGYTKREIQAELQKRRTVTRDSGASRPAQLREVPGKRAEVPGEEWRSRLMWTETQTGAYLTKNLANAATILTHHPEWKGVLAFDEFAQKIVATRCPPSHGTAFEPKAYPHVWGDHDDSLTAIWLQRTDPVLDIEVKTASAAVGVVAALQRIHPVRQYLEALAWDGVARLDSWLETYTHAEAVAGGQDYLREVGSKWMIAAVARVFEPGCKVDTVLVLEGKQGIRKSTAFRVLGQPWFTDELADVGSKDAAVQLQGAWIIELAELDALSKAESAKIKSFFTRTVERYVPKYARHSIEVPRQCVFCGTVNPDAYLKDETGNRRFWPVRCTVIDVEGLARDRDQLWAEAVHRYRAGAQWHLSADIELEARGEQEARFQADAWESVIERFTTGRTKTSVPQVLEQALKLTASDWGQQEQNRVARCLTRLGWKRKRVRMKPAELEAMGLPSENLMPWLYVFEPTDREPGEEG